MCVYRVGVQAPLHATVLCGQSISFVFSLSREEEDVAVWATPEKPPRRGLSHRSDLNAVAPAPQGIRLSLGPLSPEKLEEILHEANRLAAQLEQCALQEREGTASGLGSHRAKASPRRETFVLKDSPVRDLLPTVNSLAWSTPSPSGLTPRHRSGEKKGLAKTLRAASGKRPASLKRVSCRRRGWRCACTCCA